MYVEPMTGISSHQTMQKPQNVQPGNDGQIKTESTDGEVKRTIQTYDDAATWQPMTEEQLQVKQRTAESEKLKKAMEQMAASLPHSEPKFGIHEETNRITIKLVDKETQEVIKEIPPEKSLDLLAKSMEMAGILMDKAL